MLREMDEDDKDELLDSLKNKKLTSEEVLNAIRDLPPEARSEIRELLQEKKEEVEEEEETEETDSTKVKETKETNSKDNSKRRIRPGRKSGRAYGWWIDDDGEVVKLDIARIYSGPDEPDEVELLPKEEIEEEEDEEVA
jgi:hypothetical protein